MNEITHFLTGYLLARLVKDKSTGKRYEYWRFECFFTAIAAWIPDIDYVINKITPMEHGVITHTILGAMALALILSTITWLSFHKFPENLRIGFWRLLFLATIGVLSHLILDIVPYLPDDPAARQQELDHHMYFWPLSRFPVHINTLFPDATYTIRVVIEIVYSAIIGLYLLYDWLIKRKFFMLSLNPSAWNKGIDESYENANIAEKIYAVFWIGLILYELWVDMGSLLTGIVISVVLSLIIINRFLKTGLNAK